MPVPVHQQCCPHNCAMTARMRAASRMGHGAWWWVVGRPGWGGGGGRKGPRQPLGLRPFVFIPPTPDASALHPALPRQVARGGHRGKVFDTLFEGPRKYRVDRQGIYISWTKWPPGTEVKPSFEYLGSQPPTCSSGRHTSVTPFR
jgi:hypothetical protein